MSASTIKLRRSSVAGNKPTASQLALGEVAVNTHDGKMFFKRDKNGELSIVELGGSAVAENVFYVSKSGDDSNDGTSLDRAFLTIDKALEMAAQRRADAGLDSDGAEESVLEEKTIRDLQYYIDGAKYDIALGSKFNQVFQGRAGSYTKGIAEVLTSLEWMKAKFANSNTSLFLSTGDSAPIGPFIVRKTGNIPAKNRSDDYWDELVDIIQNGRDNADALDSAAYPNTYLATRSYYGNATIEDDATNSRDLLLANKLFLAEEVGQYIEKQMAEAPIWYNFNYNEAKCNRDTKFLVDAVRYDFLFGTNYRSVASGKRYYSGAASTVINDQKPQTVGALREAKEFTLNTITADSVDSEAGLLWDEIIQIIDSGTSAADAYQYTTLLGGTAPWPTGRDSNFGYAGDQILENKGFIQDEIIAWINKQVAEQNAPFSSSFAYNDSLCARDVGLIIDAVLYDLQYGGNLQSYDAALAYYVDGVAQYGNGEQEETIAALNRLKTVLGQIAKEETVVQSDSNGWYTSRNGNLQLNTSSPAASDSAADFAEARIQDVIYYLEQNGVNKPTKLYPDTTWATSTLQSQFALLNDSGQQVIADNTVSWISDQINLAEGFYNYSYDSV